MIKQVEDNDECVHSLSDHDQSIKSKEVTAQLFLDLIVFLVEEIGVRAVLIALRVSL